MNKTIGNFIRKIRKSKGITQEELSDLLGVSQSTYQRIESGKTYSWTTHLEKLSQILEFKPKDLFSAKENIGTIIISSISKKLIEQYEIHIKELNRRIKELERNK